MDLPMGISLIYYGVFIVYSIGAAFTLIRNYRFRLNRLLGVFLILLSFWAFGFSVSTWASNYETALFWRRFSAYGWCVAYTVMLHFMIALIQLEHSSKLKLNMTPFKWGLLYLPSLLLLLGYSIVPRFAVNQYELVETSHGWANIWVDNYISDFFSIYLFTYIAAILVLTWLWGSKINPTKNKRLASIMMAAFGGSFLVGMFVDIFAHRVFGMLSVQAAIVFGVIPAYVMYKAVRNNEFELPVSALDIRVQGVMTSAVRLKVIDYLTLLILFNAYLNFAYQFYSMKERVLSAGLYMTGLLIMAGLLQSVPHLKIKTPKADFIVLAVLTAFAPYNLLKYGYVDGALTIWVLPLFVIMLGILFASRHAILGSGLASIVVILMIGIQNPNKAVVIDGTEHGLRMLVILVFIWLALFVRKIYTTRLAENEQQIAYQQLLSKISTLMMSIDIDNTQDVIKEVFRAVGDHADYDHIFVLRVDSIRTKLVYQRQWVSEAAVPLFEGDTIYEIHGMPWLGKRLSAGNDSVLHFDDLQVPGAASERDFFEKKHAKTTLLLPIRAGGELMGILGMSTVFDKRVIGDEERLRFRTVANIMSDAYQKIRSEKEIKHLAYYDSLTKLPNRSYLTNTLKEAITREPKGGMMLLFIDLDGFKFVNDSIGHTGGDRLLQLVAERLKGCLHGEDQVFRFSGDEFVIFHRDDGIHVYAEALATEILDKFRQKFIIRNNEYMITTSIGIAQYPEDGTSVSELIKNADFAMYQAKVAGKNQFKVCTEEAKDSIHYRNRVILELHKAIDRKELEVWYQPQVDGRSGEIIGYEALLRWRSAAFGMVSPGVFIPLAEQSGQIVAIGEWVIEEVCKQYEHWHEHRAGQVPVAINLSSRQFVDEGLTAFIEATMDRYGVPAGKLEFEITERVAAEDANGAIEKLNHLRAMGMTVAIDDFGTEYSSLNRLKVLPVDRVKIEMKFVHGIGIDEKDEAIIDVIIYLAETMGLKIIAEGVENEAQLAYLMKKKCYDIQGFYYHKPMPAVEIEALYRE